MPTIVKHYDKKTGKTRVYESTPHYDPKTKQSRPKRKYLGTIDPETGELILSSGRRGRTAPSNHLTVMEDHTEKARIAELELSLSEKEEEIHSLKAEIKALKSVIISYEKICNSISNTLAKAPCDL